MLNRLGIAFTVGALVRLIWEGYYEMINGNVEYMLYPLLPGAVLHTIFLGMWIRWYLQDEERQAERAVDESLERMYQRATENGPGGAAARWFLQRCKDPEMMEHYKRAAYETHLEIIKQSRLFK